MKAVLQSQALQTKMADTTKAVVSLSNKQLRTLEPETLRARLKQARSALLYYQKGEQSSEPEIAHPKDPEPQAQKGLAGVSAGASGNAMASGHVANNLFWPIIHDLKLPVSAWACLLQEQHCHTLGDIMSQLTKANGDFQVTSFVSAIKLIVESNVTLSTHLGNQATALTVAVQHLAANMADMAHQQTAILQLLQEMDAEAKKANIPDREQRTRQLAIKIAKQQFMEAAVALGDARDAAWKGLCLDKKVYEDRIQTVIASGVITTAMLLEADNQLDANGDFVMAQAMVSSNPQASHTPGAKGPPLRPSVPAPAKFCGELDKHVTDAKVWFEHLVNYLAEFSMDVCRYLPFYLEGKALEWGMGQIATLRAENRLTAHQLQRDFLMRYDDLLFTPAKKARDKLFDRSYIQQRNEAFAAYTQRFREIIRDAKGMSEDDKIEFFVRGMQPELERKCTSHNGDMWASLEQVIQYANGQAVSMRVAARAVSNKSAVSLNAVHAPGNSRAGDKRPNNRPANGNRFGKRKQDGNDPNGSGPKRQRGPNHASGGGGNGAGPSRGSSGGGATPVGPRVCNLCGQTFTGHYLKVHQPHCPMRVNRG